MSLQILLATGIFSGGASPPSDVTTPAARRIVFTQAGAPASASQTLDPSDVLDFIMDLTAIPDEPAEDFASVTMVVVPSSAALGFQILSAVPYLPEEVGNGEIRIWATIDGPSRGLAAWAGQGTLCNIEVTATTDSAPPRTYQRTGSIRVAQK